MKSLLVSSAYFPPQTGGISNFMQSICSTMGREEICCLTGVSAEGKRRESGHGPRVYRRRSAFAKAWHVQAPSLGTALLYIVLREHPNVVQIATAYDGYIGLQLRKRFGLPYVVYAHGNEVLDAARSEWEKPRESLCQAARVLAVSRYTGSLLENMGVNPERIETFHPGCDIDRFQPREPDEALRRKLLGEAKNGRVLLSVGNLVSRKGHDMVIRALPRLLGSHGDVTYLIVGDGPYRGELEDLARSVGVRDRVVFAGQLTEETLPRVYALCDVFVLPSREQLDRCDVEGFGIVFLEASACGKAVVGGRSGGIGDAIVEGETGFLVEPREPDAIAEAIGRLIGDAELASRFGEQGRSRVVREFRWDAVAGRLRGILREVVEENFSLRTPAI
jgi:phosphatidylinositol alpha-1,6-mannosyltransferase